MAITYTIADDANTVLGPPQATPSDLTRLDREMNAGWWKEQEAIERERKNDHFVSSALTGKPQSSLDSRYAPKLATHENDGSHIHSETAYTVYGTEQTPSGKKVYVDKLPTRIPTTEAEKELYAHERAQLIGTLTGAAGIAGESLTGQLWKLPLVAKGAYEVGYDIAKGGLMWYANRPGTPLPITRDGDKEFIEMK